MGRGRLGGWGWAFQTNELDGVPRECHAHLLVNLRLIDNSLRRRLSTGGVQHGETRWDAGAYGHARDGCDTWRIGTDSEVISQGCGPVTSYSDKYSSMLNPRTWPARP